MFLMIDFHYNDLSNSQQLASQWEAQLKTDMQGYYAANGGAAAPPYSNSTMTNTTDQIILESNDAYGYLNTNNYTGVAVPRVEEDQAYYSIVALSARQIMGAYVLAIPHKDQNSTNPLMFQKEISSDGNVNTLDVMCRYPQTLPMCMFLTATDPAMPFFLYANPNLLRYNLEPLFQNQEGHSYPNEYSMHDLGSHFPNSTGHVE
jgi:hypothetical protein